MNTGHACIGAFFWLVGLSVSGHCYLKAFVVFLVYLMLVLTWNLTVANSMQNLMMTLCGTMQAGRASSFLVRTLLVSMQLASYFGWPMDQEWVSMMPGS